jgi:hypothetical protein
MFYLSLFFKGFSHRPWTGVVWFISALTILAFSYKGPDILSFTNQNVAIVQDENPYFYAIMPKKINSEYIKRKILELPGVEKVLVLSEDKVSAQIKSILDQANIEWDNELMDVNYSGIKISFSSDLKGSSQELIRNYLTRLTGKNEITMGAVKMPEVKEVQERSLFVKNKFLFLSIVVAFVYFLSLGIIYRSLKEESFVFEQYQRKGQIYLKVLSFSQAPLVLGVTLSFLFHKMAMAPLVAGVVFSLLFYLIIGEKKKVC